MKTELIIPTLDNDGSDNAEVIRKAITAMCETFGGATVFNAAGYWLSNTGHLYHDEVRVIVSAATDASAAMETLRDLAQDVLDATDQEAVFIAVGGTAEIIE